MDGLNRLIIIGLSPTGREWLFTGLRPGPATPDRPTAHPQPADFDAAFSKDPFQHRLISAS